MKVEIRRVYDAPARLTFDAWISPEGLKRWFSPGGNWTVEVGELEVTSGGKYDISLRSPENHVWRVHGFYKEVIPARKLVFTWNTDDVKDTLVSVDFRETDGKTEVFLVHDLLPNQDQVDQHDWAWRACLENLQSKVLH